MRGPIWLLPSSAEVRTIRYLGEARQVGRSIRTLDLPTYLVTQSSRSFLRNTKAPPSVGDFGPGRDTLTRPCLSLPKFTPFRFNTPSIDFDRQQPSRSPHQPCDRVYQQKLQANCGAKSRQCLPPTARFFSTLLGAPSTSTPQPSLPPLRPASAGLQPTCPTIRHAAARLMYPMASKPSR